MVDAVEPLMANQAARIRARIAEIYATKSITGEDGATYSIMPVAVPSERGRFLLEVCRAQGAASTLEIGMAWGLSTLHIFQALAEKGAEIIALPAAFTLHTGKDHWEVLLRARAIETETYVCASAQTGSFAVGNEQRHTFGHSLIADPWGHVVAKASDGVGVVSARIDKGQIKRVRSLIPVAEHRVRIARD